MLCRGSMRWVSLGWDRCNMHANHTTAFKTLAPKAQACVLTHGGQVQPLGTQGRMTTADDAAAADADAVAAADRAMQELLVCLEIDC